MVRLANSNPFRLSSGQAQEFNDNDSSSESLPFDLLCMCARVKRIRGTVCLLFVIRSSPAKVLKFGVLMLGFHQRGID